MKDLDYLGSHKIILLYNVHVPLNLRYHYFISHQGRETATSYPVMSNQVFSRVYYEMCKLAEKISQTVTIHLPTIWNPHK